MANASFDTVAWQRMNRHNANTFQCAILSEMLVTIEIFNMEYVSIKLYNTKTCYGISNQYRACDQKGIIAI